MSNYDQLKLCQTYDGGCLLHPTEPLLCLIEVEEKMLQQTTIHPFNGPLFRTTQVSRYQKGKTNLNSLEQETVSGSGIIWAICKSAPHPRQITTPAPHHLVFLQAGYPSCRLTNRVKPPKERLPINTYTPI